ncbi:27 kDa glycoprotein isoform X2 [Fopius arisanus]|uniref:27 kDa glycoprotein isoform X2 n=1 Tax=Fopius arisanus TaxID=64838 RepID=A0A9R1U9T5_9HYME|nr:PREDICTED: 27 kDa glycoprotein-like isoform X2 [Fopius arisanus]
MFCYLWGAAANSPEILKQINGIPGLEGANLTAINQTVALGKINEMKELLKEKCDKNGGTGTFDKVFAAKDELFNCVKNLVNFTVLNQEMEAAKPTGDLDIVFKKYCDKRGIFEECISNFTNVLDPCLEPIEKDNQAIVKDATHSVLDFICHKEGDRIALFIGSGGKECFQQRYTDVGKCINATYSKYIRTNDTKPGMSTFDKIPIFQFDAQKCSDASETQACIVRELEKCDDPTPGNLMDSLMTFVKRQTPCAKFVRSNAERSVAEPVISGAVSTIPYSIILLYIPILLTFV